MNKKQEARFTNLPKLNIARSRFDMDYDIKTSFNVGQLVPIGKALEVLPGDTFKFTTSSLIRLTTLISPIMDELFLDTFFFYVPFRLIWEHYVNFLGENDTSPWVSEATYSIPQITAPTGGWAVGSLADYFGVPTGIAGISISALPFRAYAKIVRDWFYDENNQIPPDLLINDDTIEGSNGDDYVTDIIKGGMPFVAAKYHDLFTSALPSPQKGESIKLPLNSIVADEIPVVPGDVSNVIGQSVSDVNGLKFAMESGDTYVEWPNNISNILNVSGYNGDGKSQLTGYGSGATTSRPGLQFDNLIATGASVISTNATINDLRLAFQTQRLLERMARSGSNRYFEILAGQWGVIAPQGLIQRSEYLGGTRQRINVNSVVQTSATDETSPQGNLAAYSVTTNKHRDFVKSFSEPGYIIPLAVVRYNHSYSQGIPKSYMRKDRFDFYNHVFAHIGEQPVKNYEIYMQGTNADNEVFGYNEAWVDYRYNPNMITGQMRPTYAQSLDFWHLGDKFEELPTLSSTFIQEDKTNVDRVLAVSSANANQIVGNFYFNIDAIRPMPLYSIPGLIDHM